ncbi:enoyl-CoA hydratase/isomerase family protein [Nocardia sp. NPDC050378]|uniref:enoyl-CoA hydratase/isomerase family protein n=1 Tax=Nocardia sp. NPDC050378 TaxID=3155400 RepID=UPI0033E039C3
MADYGQIDVTLENDVMTIAIGAIDGPTHAGLARIFRDAHHSSAKLVVVTGRDRKFVSPADYDHDWIATLQGYDTIEHLMRDAEDTLRYSITLDKPMIAKVYAPGAHQLGASLAMACDFVYAAEDATFSDPHLSGFGLPPGDGGAVLWPARVGMARAREFLMMDRVATAAEAVDIGLINKAVPAEDLDAEVDRLIEKLKSFDYSSLRMTKKSLNQYAQHSFLTVGQATMAREATRFVGK